jgi:hypothetical protein
VFNDSIYEKKKKKKTICIAFAPCVRNRTDSETESTGDHISVRDDVGRGRGGGSITFITTINLYIAPLEHKRHNSEIVITEKMRLKVYSHYNGTETGRNPYGTRPVM